MEYIVNKGRKRAPFKAGTLIDVKLRHDRHVDGLVIKRGVACSSITDWTIEDCNGDVLEYRLHEEGTKDGEE